MFNGDKDFGLWIARKVFYPTSLSSYNERYQCSTSSIVPCEDLDDVISLEKYVWDRTYLTPQEPAKVSKPESKTPAGSDGELHFESESGKEEEESRRKKKEEDTAVPVAAATNASKDRSRAELSPNKEHWNQISVLTTTKRKKRDNKERRSLPLAE